MAVRRKKISRLGFSNPDFSKKGHFSNEKFEVRDEFFEK